VGAMGVSVGAFEGREGAESACRIRSTIAYELGARETI
jgi:hypothetical protein